jgi:hypothetical protein
MGEDVLTMHEEKQALFDEEDHFNFCNDSNEEMVELRRWLMHEHEA